MRVPWPTVFALFVCGFFLSGFVMSLVPVMDSEPTAAASDVAGAVSGVALATQAPASATPTTTATPTIDAFGATSTSAAATSLAAAVAANATSTAQTIATANANATMVGGWTAEAVADADELRDAEIESVQLSNESTAWALTLAPDDATAHAPATWEAIRAAGHQADIYATARQGDANRGELVAWSGAGALALAFITAGVGVGVVIGATANRIEAKANAELIRAKAEAEAIRARAGIATRDIPVNPGTPDETVLVDADGWRTRLLAFAKQSILLSPGAGPAATTVTPANHDGWSSRAEWSACVTEMERRGWVTRLAGRGGATTLTGGRTMGDILDLLTVSNYRPTLTTTE